MARTVETEEERERRIVLVGEYVISTGASTRKAAEYFSDNFFAISNCTVSDYCNRYCKMNPESLEIMRKRIDDNTPDDISCADVKKRVLVSVELFKEGINMEEIANTIGCSFWTTYRDLTKRFKTLNPVEFESIIVPKLRQDSLDNIKRK